MTAAATAMEAHAADLQRLVRQATGAQPGQVGASRDERKEGKRIAKLTDRTIELTKIANDTVRELREECEVDQRRLDKLDAETEGTPTTSEQSSDQTSARTDVAPSHIGLDLLPELARLRDAGVITEEDFAVKKQQILDRL